MGNPQPAMTHRARAEPWSESADQQRESGERRGSGQRLKMHLTSLPLHLDALRFVIDGRGTLIHVALTARGQLYSGPSPGLEKAQSGQPEGRKSVSLQGREAPLETCAIPRTWVEGIVQKQHASGRVTVRIRGQNQGERLHPGGSALRSPAPPR